MCCANGDSLGKKLLSIEKDEKSDSLQTMRGENLAASRLLVVGREVAKESYGSHLVSLPVALPRLPPKGYMRLLVLMVDDEVCFFFNCGTATNVRFDGLRGSLRTGVQRNRAPAGGRQEPRHREAGRREDGNVTTPAHRGRAALRPGLFILHMVQRSWPRSRSPDAPHSREAARGNDMTSH